MTNNGPDEAIDGLTVTDRLPDGLSFADESVSAGSEWDCAQPVARDVTCTWVGATATQERLAAGELLPPIIVRTTIDEGSTGDLVNLAKVTSSREDLRE